MKVGDNLLKIAICDDEPLVLDKVSYIIQEYGEQNNLEIDIRKFTSSILLMESIHLNFDIFYLDIQISGMNGMELARIIRKRDKRAYLVFLTSYGKYVYEGYEVNAANYIRKPPTRQIIFREMDRAIEQIQKKDSYIMVKNNDGFYKVYLSSLRYIETYKRNTLLHTDSEEIISFKKMKDHEQQLKGYPFFRCHNSYIINMHYISKIIDMEILLITGETIYVSKKKKIPLMKSFSEYIGSDL